MPLSLIRLRQIRKNDQLDDQKTPLQISNVETTATNLDDLQDGILSQLKRIIWGDTPGNWNDDFASQYVNTLEELSNGRLIFANCLVTDVEGDLVRITGADTLNIANVTRVNPEYTTEMPCFGMLVEKITATTAIVQTSGRVKVITLPVMIPGKRYFVGLDGRPSQYPADLGLSTTGIALWQVLGVARDVNVLELNISMDMIKQK